MFQFHTGSIKSEISVLLRDSFTGFNSILVRLKDHKQTPLNCLLPGFNSILVRLKDPFAVYAFSPFFSFQFHTGSIKSSGLSPISKPLRGFNSILVRLKVSHSNPESRAHQFQFHTGSIKRQGYCRHAAAKMLCFNSILVRLKACADAQAISVNLVSIPYWFD